MVKNLPARQETCVSSLGQEGPLEKVMATHSSILENSMDRVVWRVSELDTCDPWALEREGSVAALLRLGCFLACGILVP